MMIKAERWLLIDNSNTRTKLMFAVEKQLSNELHYIPTAELTVERIREVVGEVDVSLVVVCSVVPGCRAVISAAFECPVHFVSADSPMRMRFLYEGTSTLGADRIVNALAVSELYHGPCIAVDSGTATTFDVVLPHNESPVYVGGAIAPGVSAFCNYLHQYTAQLPRVSIVPHCPAVGKNTVQAMQSGALYGFCGMVKGIIESMETELNTKLQVILTGGDGSLLLRNAKITANYVKCLTFYGLLHIAKHL